ncbi:MAG: hypothetical protein COB93_08235 [Sneathiella sp.]|nr:MAG: hypothetical protein COB93_08235 [Sneathiella sp.]
MKLTRWPAENWRAILLWIVHFALISIYKYQRIKLVLWINRSIHARIMWKKENSGLLILPNQINRG